MLILIFEKENIIKYERAFGLPSGQICIVMELAVNDLETQLKARQNGKRRSNLSLECIRSICRQALSGLGYLHDEGITHRDLKPANMLVIKWDIRTDTPTIKLGDFGLAGIDPQHKTLCGTEGYVAPEIREAYETAKKLRKQRDKWMKTVPQPMYTNAVDIWTLGKILRDLVRDAPSRRSFRGKTAPVNKKPAFELIDRMMQHDPDLRPTAAECLKDPWMVTMGGSDSLLAQKRDRSPTPSTSNRTSTAGQPLRKVIRRAFEDSVATEKGSTIMIMNVIWPDARSEQQNGSSHAPRVASTLDVEMKDRSFVEEGQIPRYHSQATQLTIQLGEDGRLSLTAHSHNDTLILDSLVARDENIPPATLADNTGPQGASSSMQDAAYRLLAALQAEGYGHNVTIAGNNAEVRVIRNELSRLSISSIQVRQESSVMLGLEELTSSFWNEGQSPSNSHIGSESAGPADRNSTAAADDASRPRCLQVLFGQVRPASSLDEPCVREPVRALDQFSMPIITLNGAITDKTLSVTQPSVTSMGSGLSWSTEANKGVTYPSRLDDIMGTSF